MTSCLGYQKAKSVTLVGPEQVRGKSTWHVRVVDSNEQQRDFWIEPVAGFPVHRQEFSTNSGIGNCRTEVYCGDNSRCSWLPSRVETKYDNRLNREVTVSNVEFDVRIPPETWTFAGLDLLIGTPIADLRIHQRIGYWDGAGLSQDLPPSVRRSEATPKPAAPKANDSSGKTSAAKPADTSPGANSYSGGTTVSRGSIGGSGKMINVAIAAVTGGTANATQGFVIGGPLLPEPTMTGPARLADFDFMFYEPLRYDARRAELHLTRDQEQKLQELDRKYRAEFPPIMRKLFQDDEAATKNLTALEKQRRLNEVMAAARRQERPLRRDVEAMLTPEQLAKLENTDPFRAR